MRLNAKERLAMSQLFPQKGNLVEQTLVTDIANKVKLSQEETEKIGLKVTSKGLTWNSNNAADKEVEFTRAEIGFLKSQVTRLDKEKNVTQDLLELCLRIKNL